MVDLTIDTSAIADGQSADAADVVLPFEQVETHLENILNGVQGFDQLKFNAATELTIDAAGAITVTQSYHTVDTENNDPTDNLDTISGGVEGDILYLRAADSARTVSLRHIGGGTGNARIWDGSNIDLDETYKILVLFCDGTNWSVVGFIGSGGGGGAPTNATYITQTPDGTLSNEQALSTLETGIMHVTTATGVVGSYKTNSTTTDPTTGDDSGDGYTVGSRWLNTSTDKEFVCLDNSLGAAVWKETTASGTGISFAILRDEKSTGTAGGASSIGWNARELNTEVSDPDNIVTVASNQLTPIAGNYILMAQAAAGHASSATLQRLRLFNVTGAASVEEGLGSRTGTTNERTMISITVPFTANGTDSYRIDHYTSTAQASTGLGAPMSDGSNEVYLSLLLMKVG